MGTQHDDDAEIHVNSGVSVVMPVLNEQTHLQSAVESILTQEYDGDLELVLALGPSTDNTDQIAERLAQTDPRILLVKNRSGATADGLNAAIAASRHPIVIRVDAHSTLEPEYVRRAVAELTETGADNVGGVMAAVGETPWEQAVAAAMTSRVGVGNAAYHVGGQAGDTSSVYLGCFRRSALNRVGGFDPRFKRAQDWELNHRIRSSGGTVWFSPKLRVNYRPRSSWRALARQYFEYGRWRRAVMRTYPQTRSLRYLAAPLLVVSLVGLFLMVLVGWWIPLAFWVGVFGLITYLAAAVLAGIAISRKIGLTAKFLAPIALVTMHLSWGIGFLTSPRRLSLRS